MHPASLGQALTLGDLSSLGRGHLSKHPMQTWIPLPSSPSHRSDEPESPSSALVSSRHPPHLPFAPVAKVLMAFHLSDPLLVSGLVTPTPNDTALPLKGLWLVGSDTFMHLLAEVDLMQVLSGSILPQFLASGEPCGRVLDSSHGHQVQSGPMQEPTPASPYHMGGA